MQNVWGEENVPENALSRKFLDPSKRASGLLCRGFLYRKSRALTPEGGGKRTVRGGVQNPFLGGVSFVRFSTPLFFPPPPWRPLTKCFTSQIAFESLAICDSRFELQIAMAETMFHHAIWSTKVEPSNQHEEVRLRELLSACEAKQGDQNYKQVL